MEILTTLIGALIFALTLWGSIKLVDRYNSQNKLAVAGIIGVVFGFCAPALGSMFMILPLVALMYLLIQFYDLGLIRSFAVVGAMFASNLLLAPIVRELSRLAA